MLNFTDVEVADFGKVIFTPKNHTMPALPDMNLIIFKKEDGYQAICINLEIDAVGDNFKECCNNLKCALFAYISQMVNNYGGDVNAAVKDIINTSYSRGELKSQLFIRYLQEKHQYLLKKIAKGHKAKSRRDEFTNAWNRVFQTKPIQFNLAVAASFA